MSLQRSLLPLCHNCVFATRSSTTSIPRTCAAASRQFTCALRRRNNSTNTSAKRKLVTATAYRPSTFEPLPVPPRNSNVPDTSIAGGAESTTSASSTTASIPMFHDIRPPKIRTKEEPEISLTEGEAQKSRPVAAAATATTTTTTTKLSTSTPEPTKPKRPRLRPRKAAMNLTPGAVEHLKALLSLPEPKMIRVGVKNRGCSGLAYHLEYVDKAGTFDEAVEQDGVKVLIDSKALFSIIGSEMDWVEDKLSQRFVFKNPNIKEECGCGESFMV